MAQLNRIEALTDEFAEKLADELISIVGDLVPTLLEKVAEKLGDRLQALTHPAEQIVAAPEMAIVEEPMMTEVVLESTHESVVEMTESVVVEKAPSNFVPLPESPHLFELVEPASPVKKEKIDLDFWIDQIVWAQEDGGFGRLLEIKSGISIVMQRIKSSQPVDYKRLYALVGKINEQLAARSDANAERFLDQLDWTCQRLFAELGDDNIESVDQLLQEFCSLGETLAQPRKYFGEALERVAENVARAPLAEVRKKFLADLGKATRQLQALKTPPTLAIHTA
ncbi:MAG: hypothetical protein A3E36_01615 [Candidatus Andersenbacteria bacterium RIFCSPHIGHO2_12_FULL_45_11b]|uniref:Uncharacterized protein n=1 Tax=Candidatus Andersenbacteria bacterium RIFCSPHIGHO2_12_FULL_45_11b TaxID=1797282 RepID=A0A1G1XCQ7_9BACT|nr:MAG: hypothetical protein A3E36_01615 [Candidatus Andersenbacteria bacterium RIFCSPHIGHO2_12_FULL_45_11b]